MCLVIFFDILVKKGSMSIDAINFTIPTEDEDIKFTFSLHTKPYTLLLIKQQ